MENNDIRKLVKDIFDPLVFRLGLHEIAGIPSTNTELIWGYVNNDIGVQITIDLSDFFIFILLFKPKDNSIPVGYEDDSGKRQKVYLQAALEELGINNVKETKRLKQLGGNYLNCKEMVLILAQLLESNWLFIQSDLDKLFK